MKSVVFQLGSLWEGTVFWGLVCSPGRWLPQPGQYGMFWQLHDPIPEGHTDGRTALGVNVQWKCSVFFTLVFCLRSSLDVLCSLTLHVRPGVSGGQRGHHGHGDEQSDRRGFQQPHPVCQSQHWQVLSFFFKNVLLFSPLRLKSLLLILFKSYS